jgi:hypothetical protein
MDIPSFVLVLVINYFCSYTSAGLPRIRENNQFI